MAPIQSFGGQNERGPDGTSRPPYRVDTASSSTVVIITTYYTISLCHIHPLHCWNTHNYLWISVLLRMGIRHIPSPFSTRSFTLPFLCPIAIPRMVHIVLSMAPIPRQEAQCVAVTIGSSPLRSYAIAFGDVTIFYMYLFVYYGVGSSLVLCGGGDYA